MFMSDIHFSGKPRGRTERRHLPAGICSERGSTMQATTLRLRRVAWGHRLMSATMALGFLLVLGFAQPAAAQSASAGSVNGPLTFGNNFFVTGDYVVGGAQGLNNHLVNGFGTGTITIPDANPGITGAKSVPPGAQIIAALLYWQTVEKSGVMAGQPG